MKYSLGTGNSNEKYLVETTRNYIMSPKLPPMKYSKSNYQGPGYNQLEQICEPYNPPTLYRANVQKLSNAIYKEF